MINVEDRIRLKLKGFGFHLVEPLPNTLKYSHLDEAAEYILGDAEKNYPYFKNMALCMRISEDDLGVLFYLAMSPKAHGENAPILARDTNHDLLATKHIVNSLVSQGYLDTYEFNYQLTEKAYVALLQARSIKSVKLIGLDKERDESFHNAIRSVFGGQVSYEPGKSYILEDNSDSEDLIEELPKLMDSYFSGNIGADRLVFEIDKRLTYIRNRRYKEALAELGYKELDLYEKVTLIILCNVFLKKGPVNFSFTDSDSPIDKDNKNFGQLCAAARSLVTKGLLVTPPVESGAEKAESYKPHYMISTKVAGLLFRGVKAAVNYSNISNVAEVFISGNLEKRNLFFNDGFQDDVNSLLKMTDASNYEQLIGRLSTTGRKGLTMLFYGAPGVGKTQLVKEMARVSGRDIIAANVSKILGEYVGQSEKNIRSLFTQYKYLSKVCLNAPILLLNEADSIMGKRFGDIGQYCEQSFNAMQGVILEELENFEGILVATTNLSGNLDGACDRRFLYKLRFETPSFETRVKILQDRMNWLSTEQAQAIAHEFSLSPAQIENIEAKRIIYSFLHSEDTDMDTLRHICREEMSLREPESERRRVGF